MVLWGCRNRTTEVGDIGLSEGNRLNERKGKVKAADPGGIFPKTGPQHFCNRRRREGVLSRVSVRRKRDRWGVAGMTASLDGKWNNRLIHESGGSDPLDGKTEDRPRGLCSNKPPAFGIERKGSLCEEKGVVGRRESAVLKDVAPLREVIS